MNPGFTFGQPAATPATTAAAAAAPVSGGFSFGGGGGGGLSGASSGFSFGASTAPLATPAAAPTFSFPPVFTAAAAVAPSLAVAKTTATTAVSFGFGATPTAGMVSGFGSTGFGTTPGALGMTPGALGMTPGALGTTSIGLSAVTTTTPVATPGGFGGFGNLATPLATATATTAPTTGGFILGGFKMPTMPVAAAPVLSSATTTPAAAPAPAAVPITSSTPSVSSVASSTAGNLTFNFGPTTATPAASTLGKGLGGIATATATATTTAVTVAPAGFGAGFSLSGATAVTSKPAATALTTATTLSASKAMPTTPTAMTYRQLEEAINKWSCELDEQEKIFLQQATHVNAWDRILCDNGEKITQLNADVNRVKIDQGRLDQELDFILSQQRDLEELLVPLQQAMELLPPISYQQHADFEREHTYKLARNVDGQLKRMVQDLREIVEHLNTNAENQDSNDAIFQISKILNAHMDSLQWVDQNTAVLQRRVDEISKLVDLQRKEQERNFRLAYD